ncbi:MAG: hypothetical protein M1827_000542 [Pycnora praestabilis]|nr:MAG: hypothetical protein M1827_000542 [Pycnora praestabilis]
MSAALQIAETIQTASINRAPSPTHDLNPSTAASSKQPVTLRPSDSNSDTEESHNEDDITQGREVEERGAEIPYDTTIKPVKRKAALPPLPDLRFEQSYLASIREADTWRRVGWITVRDQVFLPLLQGTIWTLALSGWRFWNRSAKFSGQSVGSRIRRWWWEVNDWKIPTTTERSAAGRIGGDEKLAGKVGEVSFYLSLRMAEVGEGVWGGG